MVRFYFIRSQMHRLFNDPKFESYVCTFNLLYTIHLHEYQYDDDNEDDDNDDDGIIVFL